MKLKVELRPIETNSRLEINLEDLNISRKEWEIIPSHKQADIIEDYVNTKYSLPTWKARNWNFND